jgi:hypothetical protein
MMNYPAGARGHMPFPGHRTQKEVREDEEYERALKRWEKAKTEITRNLGRDESERTQRRRRAAR